MRELNKILRIERKISIVFHPQTDEQTERVGIVPEDIYQP